MCNFAFRMMVLMVLSVHASPQESGDTGPPLAEPYAMLIRNRDFNVELHLQRQQMLNPFLPPELQSNLEARQMIEKLQTNTWLDYQDENPVYGDAYCVNDAGRDVILKFRTAAEELQYLYMIEHTKKDTPVERGIHDHGFYTRFDEVWWPGGFGDMTKVQPKRDGDGNLVRDRNGGLVMETIRKRIRMGSYGRPEAYVGYRNGVIVYRSDYVPRAPYADIARLAKKGQGVDWGVLVNPSALPLASRKENLKRFALSMGTRKQRRDDESAAAHLPRASRLAAYEQLVKMFWLDVESVWWTVTEPTLNKPYRTRFELKARPDSDLSRHLKSLPSSKLPAIDVEDSLLQCTTAFRVPEQFRSTFVPWIQHSKIAGSRTGAAIEDFLTTGDCRSQATLRIDQNQEPVVEAIVATVTESLTRNEIAAAFFEKDMTTQAQNIRFGSWSMPVMFNAEIVDRNLCFAIGRDVQLPQCPEPVSGVGPKRKPSGTLFAVQLDLGQLAGLDSEHSAMRFAKRLEQLVAEFRPAVDPRIFRPEGFQSLTEKITSDGDWSAKCEARIVGNRLVIDAQVGTDLMALCRSRMLMDGVGYP